jgi:hypothetical protein
LHGVDGHDAVFAGGDEGFGVGEGEGRDLADMEVLEEAGGLEGLAIECPSKRDGGNHTFLLSLRKKRTLLSV